MRGLYLLQTSREGLIWSKIQVDKVKRKWIYYKKKNVLKAWKKYIAGTPV